MKNILVIGNCQTLVISQVLRVIIPGANVYRFAYQQFRPSKWKSGGISADLVVHQDLDRDLYRETQYLIRNIEEQGVCVLHIPRISFSGSLPDCVYVKNKSLKSPINYHSFIVVSSFLLGFSEDQCYRLFTKNIYDKLGYIQMYDTLIHKFKKRLISFGFSTDLVERWAQSGNFMHTVNHPKLFVMEDLIKEALNRNNIPFSPVHVSSFIGDHFLNSGSVFPPNFDTLSGEPMDKDHLLFKDRKGAIYNLQEFICSSYKIYHGDEVTPEQMGHPRFNNGGLQRLENYFHEELDQQNRKNLQKHPYKGKPDYCFWKKSISTTDIHAIDPVVTSDLKIRPEEKIATAGSCFAQHIAKRLKRQGFNYFVAEQAPPEIPPEAQAAQGYGVFSCRYGNIYTARQLLQLFDRAFDEYSPDIAPWLRPDGRFVDPFRPQVNPDGYATQEEVVTAQTLHLEAVRRMFLELDIFVFTLGLTECWEHLTDRAILPLAPGVVAGELDWDRYRFVNFGAEQVKRDMDAFLAKLISINPAARVILTVSPVPLMATYEDRHVLVSTTVSKSILRVVADEVSNDNSLVSYFPSYEIITGNFNHGRYYQDDLRDVRPEGVDHVMRLFIQHCTLTQAGAVEVPDAPSRAPQNPHSTNTNPLFISDTETDELEDVICDEENLDV